MNEEFENKKRLTNIKEATEVEEWSSVDKKFKNELAPKEFLIKAHPTKPKLDDMLTFNENG